MTTFPNPSPAPERAEHPRASTVPRELRPVVHMDPGPNPTPEGPQPAETPTLPVGGESMKMPGATEPGAPGLPAIPKS